MLRYKYTETKLFKKSIHNEDNYINLLHSDELLNSNTKNIKIKEQLISKLIFKLR